MFLFIACSRNYFIQSCRTERSCKMAFTISEHWVRWKAYRWCNWEGRDAGCASRALFKGCSYSSLSGKHLRVFFTVFIEFRWKLRLFSLLNWISVLNKWAYHFPICFCMFSYDHLISVHAVPLRVYHVVTFIDLLTFQFQNFFSWVLKCVKILLSEPTDQVPPANRFMSFLLSFSLLLWCHESTLCY
jgi:hypothetical protein